MSENKCGGGGESSETCVFHKQYAHKIDTVWDWHLGVSVKMETLLSKIQTTNATLISIAALIATDIIVRIIQG